MIYSLGKSWPVGCLNIYKIVNQDEFFGEMEFQNRGKHTYMSSDYIFDSTYLTSSAFNI